MTRNPYPTRQGFGLRVRCAKAAYEAYGRDYDRKPYSRALDNCFEMFDSNAVVWALMHEAIVGGNADLAEGIRRTGKDVWPRWLEVYEQRGAYAPRHEQLGLFAPTALPRKNPKSPSMS